MKFSEKITLVFSGFILATIFLVSYFVYLSTIDILEEELDYKLLKVFKTESGVLDLVITDSMLPDKNGIQLTDVHSASNPDIRVLLTSGYMDVELHWPDIKKKGYRFLQKPYDPPELLDAIRGACAGQKSAF